MRCPHCNEINILGREWNYSIDFVKQNGDKSFVFQCIKCNKKFQIDWKRIAIIMTIKKVNNDTLLSY